jgi:hypothetical protein
LAQYRSSSKSGSAPGIDPLKEFTVHGFKISRLLVLPLARALPMQPDGLAPGESYHWMFITRGTIDSTSADIAVYDAFANAEAALNPDLAGLSWHAIASTETVDARLNAPVNGPVFLLDGARFADDFPDMWDGSNVPFNAVPEIDQFGVVRVPDSAPWVWTGTDHDGTAFGLGLGGQADNWAGRYTSVFPTWLIEVHLGSNTEFPIYALSGPIKAQAVPTVPEPSGMALLGIVLGSLVLRRRES